MSTKATAVKAANVDVVDNKHHHPSKPVTTSDVNQSKVSSQGVATFIQFADQSYNITATVDLGLSTSFNKHSSERGVKSFNSQLDETQNGSGFFWANGNNTLTQSSADQETQLKYKDSDRCQYSREVKIKAQKVVGDKIDNKCK